jgi:hypothetical protein
LASFLLSQGQLQQFLLHKKTNSLLEIPQLFNRTTPCHITLTNHTSSQTLEPKHRQTNTALNPFAHLPLDNDLPEPLKISSYTRKASSLSLAFFCAAALSCFEKMLRKRHLCYLRAEGHQRLNENHRLDAHVCPSTAAGAELRVASPPPRDPTPCARSPPTTCRTPCTRPQSSRRRAPWSLAISRMRVDAKGRKPRAEGGKETSCEVLSTRVFALPVRSKQLYPAHRFGLSQCERG